MSDIINICKTCQRRNEHDKPVECDHPGLITESCTVYKRDTEAPRPQDSLGSAEFDLLDAEETR